MQQLHVKHTSQSWRAPAGAVIVAGVHAASTDINTRPQCLRRPPDASIPASHRSYAATTARSEQRAAAGHLEVRGVASTSAPVTPAAVKGQQHFPVGGQLISLLADRL